MRPLRRWRISSPFVRPRRIRPGGDFVAVGHAVRVPVDADAEARAGRDAGVGDGVGLDADAEDAEETADLCVGERRGARDVLGESAILEEVSALASTDPGLDD